MCEEINVRQLIIDSNENNSSYWLSRVPSLINGTGERFYVCVGCGQSFRTKKGETLFFVSEGTEDSRSHGKSQGYCKDCYKEKSLEKVKEFKDVNEMLYWFKYNFNLLMFPRDSSDEEDSWFIIHIGRADIKHRFYIDLQAKFPDVKMVFLAELGLLFDMEYRDIDSKVIQWFRSKELAKIKKEKDFEVRYSKHVKRRALIFFVSLSIILGTDYILRDLYFWIVSAIAIYVSLFFCATERIDFK